MKAQSKREKASGDQEDVWIKKFCQDCKTTKTPMWRVGPAGPNSLCNACGIRFGKKSRKSNKKSQNRSKNGCVEVDGNRKKVRDLKVCGSRDLAKEVVLVKKQRSSTLMTRKQWKMGEVEQAALLLMSLSYASVYLPKI